MPGDSRYDAYPPGFFQRSDESDDAAFYGPPRLVTHIDDGAIEAVGVLYAELGLGGERHVLDLMASWVSHFRPGGAPARLTVLGMNAAELARNPRATARVTRDLNRDPVLPFPDAAFDGAVCCVSVDYLTRPLEVFDEVARVLVPGAPFVCTFSNRCFPTKAIRGWLGTNDRGHVDIVASYFASSTGWDCASVRAERRPTAGHDPLFAVWAHRTLPSGA